MMTIRYTYGIHTSAVMGIQLMRRKNGFLHGVDATTTLNFCKNETQVIESRSASPYPAVNT